MSEPGTGMQSRFEACRKAHGKDDTVPGLDASRREYGLARSFLKANAVVTTINLLWIDRSSSAEKPTDKKALSVATSLASDAIPTQYA